MDTIIAKISGKVQGVGFRYTARHHAEKLSIAGTAQNLPDGTVQIVVQGQKETLQSFFELLKEQFTIRDITMQHLNSTTIYSGFQIIH